MIKENFVRSFLPFLTVLVLLSTGGCAGTVEHWIVNTRVNQGDVALRNGSLHEAEIAYRLALRVNPHDARARAGFADASADIAQVDFHKGDFDDATATINAALKYDPQNVRLQALLSQLQDARLKREIVIANYPTYKGAGTDIQAAYASLNVQTKAILAGLKRFNYTYDTQDLTKAIQDSYELQLDVAKNTNRLIAYRQLVESGVPGAEQSAQGSAPTGSLLPLP
jgi:tetratricopeptide (TPR) repeat protein